MRTAESVIASFTNRTVGGEIIAPEEWLMAAQMLTVLMSQETNKLHQLQSTVAKIKYESIENGNTAAKAKIQAEASNEYLDMKKQEAFVEQIKEFIRVSKKQAEIGK